ncbi:MAG TPA: sigma 54-interacting transcriptional regulator [Polyangiaceae bacterium]|nr:sigma 54-interacting transcriptional regulator [Polyangiaceae bacterium]
MTPFEQATRARTAPTRVRYAKIHVAVVEGPDAGVSRELAGNCLRVGTSFENDLVLSDGTVSRQHCTIEPLEGGVRVRDEGSTNGLTLGRTQFFDAVIRESAQVRLGDTVLSLSLLADIVEKEQANDDRFGALLGKSARMRELFADLMRIAPTDVTLLVEGETGTGKELVAESVHQASSRADGPFVVFDCGAIAPTLAESELFGHERGAFTGAINSRPGVFEQAHGGTIFLDELGELPRDLQPRLLRVLEKREVRRLGSERTIPVDVRLIAATNRNLAAEVERHNFREDLYFRVAATHVYIPPLRERMDDLPALVEHFLALAKPPRSASEIPKQVWSMFRAHRWPGNVRELSNAVQRFIVTPDRLLRTSSSQSAAAMKPVAPLCTARRVATDAFEREYLHALLTQSGGNVTRAAALAEVSRQMIQKLMRKHDVD